MAALLLLYRDVVGRPLAGLGEVVRARAPVRLPVGLTRAEVERVLAGLRGTMGLVGAVCGPGDGAGAAASSAPIGGPAGDGGGGAGERDREAGDGSHVAALVRDASAGGGVRHSDGARAAGSSDVSTTMIYTHVLNRGGRGVESPADWPVVGRSFTGVADSAVGDKVGDDSAAGPVGRPQVQS